MPRPYADAASRLFDKKCLSPSHFECELDIAWLIALSRGLYDLPKCSICRAVVVVAREDRMIRQIECIHSELCAETLVDVEVLRQAGIDIVRTWVANAGVVHIGMDSVGCWYGDKVVSATAGSAASYGSKSVASVLLPRPLSYAGSI